MILCRRVSFLLQKWRIQSNIKYVCSDGKITMEREIKRKKNVKLSLCRFILNPKIGLILSVQYQKEYHLLTHTHTYTYEWHRNGVRRKWNYRLLSFDNNLCLFQNIYTQHEKTNSLTFLNSWIGMIYLLKSVCTFIVTEHNVDAS